MYVCVCMFAKKSRVILKYTAFGLYHLQQTTLDVRKYFFSNRVVNIWNELPSEIRYASSVNTFKNLYDLYTTTMNDTE